MGVMNLDQPVHLIINPHSGYGGSRHMLCELHRRARQAGIQLISYTTRAPDDATRYSQDIAGRAGAVIVWGGDGTVNEVAHGLAGTNVPILPCPVGTESLLAREVRVPRGPASVIDLLQTGRVVSCDLGRVNGHGFLLIVGVGFDAEVVQRVTADRTGHISHLTYFWPIWRTFWEHTFPQMKIVADGEEVFEGIGLAFVGNISRYATGLRICRDAHFNDGVLDLVVFPCHQKHSLVFHAVRTILRSHPGRAGVIYRHFRHLTVATEAPVPCQVDGDVGPCTPLEISVDPGQIELIVPGDFDGRRNSSA